MAKRERVEPTPLARMIRNGLLWGLLLIMVLLVAGAVSRKEANMVVGIQPYVEPLGQQDYLIDTADLKEILARSFTQPIHTMRLGEIDVERVERVLEEDPFVLDAEAYVDARNRLHVSATQRLPLVRVKDNNGLDYYLDEHGQRMPLSRHFAARVPIITGNVAPWDEDYLEPKRQHMLRDLFELAKTLREDEFLRALVEQIFVTSRAELVLVPKVGDQTILLGRYDRRTQERLERLKVFYREGLPYEGWQSYRSFDLRFADQVVCRKR